jgi:hypothetical protein
MKKLSKALCASALVAGLTLAAASGAHAHLIWSITAGGFQACAVDDNAFTCSHGLQIPDGADADPGILDIFATLGNFVVDGFFNLSFKASGPPLFSNVLAYLTDAYANIGPTAITAAIAVSDTGYSDANTATTSAEGVWVNAAGSSLTMSWYVDPANAQGATNPADRPGALIDSFTNSPAGACECFDYLGGPFAVAPGPFSMTLGLDLTLTPGGELQDAIQDAFAELVVAEPTTIALFALALAALGATRRRASARAA